MNDNINNTFAEWIMERKSELEDAFKSAESVAERIEIFENMCFTDSEIAIYSCSIIHTLLMQPHNPQQVFSFGKLVLTVHSHKIDCFGLFRSKIPRLRSTPRSHDHNTRTSHGSTLYVACVCYLLASACYGLKRYDESLRFLDWDDSNLDKLDKDDNSRCPRHCVRFLLAISQKLRYNVKVAMGKRDEALVHVGKALEFKELMMKEGSIENGKAYIEAYEAYVTAKDAKEALPLCLKALEICIKCYGQDSNEVVLLRVDLAVLYHVVGEYEKETEQNLLWQSAMKNTDTSSDLLNAELKVGTMLIHFGMCDDAIKVMRVVASRIDTEKGGRVVSYVSMASASYILEEFDDAKEHMRAAERIVEEDDIDDPIFVDNVFLDMSGLYEKMSDFETAISLLERVMEKAEHHQEILVESSEKLGHQKIISASSKKLFSLISLAGREKKEMLLFMIHLMKKLEKIFGWEHLEVGYGCSKLGSALMNSGQEEEAVTLMKNAKHIMDVTLGLHHVDSLRTSHALSEIYAKLGRYNEAIEVQTKVVEDLKGLEPSKQHFIDKAVRLLNVMKERVAESPTRASSQSQDGKDLSAEKPECGTSGDGPPA